MPRMTDRELIRLALTDAYAYQHGLADAHSPTTVAGRAALVRATQYKELLARKYGGLSIEDAERRVSDKRVMRSAAEQRA